LIITDWAGEFQNHHHHIKEAVEMDPQLHHEFAAAFERAQGL
jgi:hypothetical protein